MGWLIVAFGTVFLLMVGHIQDSQRTAVMTMQQSGGGYQLSRQMLLLAAGINDWRYRHAPADGTVALSALALPVTPDSRIRHLIVGNRLWVWMPEVPGLVDALREQSGGSALIGTVKQGQLVWLSGVTAGLPLPAGIQNGDVVYLN
ncbi:type IV pilus biogenesis protein PilM [Salmonella enterica]|uniref:Pilus assembly protein PilP n=1 Tax=Salmonella enterica subsp. enterica serovar Albany TaxID=211968 RepID=A0A607Y9W7_SALET|nr:pilus assembly protein PilP [Salmonella enterica]EAO6491398.1 pilus assembly protein PilP [Salmonella enterica subsp. enterica serovar Albany]ECQ4393857.1 type IV pilus biogenesis protein PilM [Salmonella enterica subsp. enterica]EAP6826348.1 pilus assembly protein PilP [Salmonella enterica]EAU5603504.1 pilus assembly protein PilP [Salmonella enterica]